MTINDRIRVYGKHAYIIKKYSRDKQAEEKVIFSVRNVDNKNEDIVIFDTMIDCVMTAMMMGIVEKRQAKEDNDNSISPATIFLDIVQKKANIFERIFNHMIMMNDAEPIEKCIRKAFGVIDEEDQRKELDNLFSYMRGGLEIIDEYFSKCQTIEELLNVILEIRDNYSIESLEKEI